MSPPEQAGFRQWSRGGSLDLAYAGEPETVAHPEGTIEWHAVWGEPGSAYRFGGRSVSGPGLVIGASYAGTGVLTRRSAATVRRADSDWLICYLPLAGSVAMTTRRGDLVLRPGQFGLLPSAEPVDVRVSRRARTLTMFFPRTELDELIAGTEGRYARAVAANPASRLLVRHLALTLQLGPVMDGNSCAAATRAAAELLAAAASSASPESAESHDAVRIAQLKHYIDRSLALPSLSVAQVAAANFVSARTVQRLFAASGETAAGYIRRRRLEMCRADILASPTAAISEICQRWGLPDSSHLARQFRAEFGVTPEEIRARAR
jgi:AraC-like DNA-binding protein